MTFHLPPTISLDVRHRRTALPGYRGLHRPLYYHSEIKLHHPQVILYDFLTNQGILLHNQSQHQNQEINKDALLPSKLLFPLKFCQLPRQCPLLAKDPLGNHYTLRIILSYSSVFDLHLLGLWCLAVVCLPHTGGLLIHSI